VIYKSALSLFSNIKNNYVFLKEDLTSFSPNYLHVFNFIFDFLIAVLLMVLCLVVGFKIRQWLFKKKTNSLYSSFVEIAIGYVFIQTGIAFLGFFSLLSKTYLSIYLLLIILASVSSLKDLTASIRNFLISIKKSFSSNNFIKVFVFIFIFLAFLNLINPEIREDQYHVDFARMYLSQQTTMIKPVEQIMVSGGTMLAEMQYITGIFLGTNQVARNLHFIFYFLTISLLLTYAKQKGNSFAFYAPLIFASAPEIVRETSSAYIDFQWIFCQFLSILVISQIGKKDSRNVLIAGLLTGGMLATKLWTIAFFPIHIAYLFFVLRKQKTNIVTPLILFISTSIIIPLIWYIRSFILTGTPFYPFFFIKSDTQRLTGINYDLFNINAYLKIFSPLFFIGAALLIFNLKKCHKILKANNIFVFLLLMTLLLLVIKYYFGRYLLGYYVFLSIFSSIGFVFFARKTKIIKILVGSITFLIFIYYFINSLITLPYALGFANKDKYLTRTLSKDFSSYYNFNNKFEKYFSKNDCIATYQFFGFYYANFCYSDTNFIFINKNKSINTLKKMGYTKLLLKNNTSEEFCKKEKIGCTSRNFILLDSFNDASNYYLYEIK
jgi:hypothetical protein